MEWLAARHIERSSFTPPSTEGSFVEPGQMRFAYFSNEFPQDDLQSLLRRLHVHSKSGQLPTLARFIHEATQAIREEIRELPAALRKLVPTFESTFEFADNVNLRTGPLGGSIDGALLVTLQLGALIGFYESQSFDETDAHLVDTCLAGLGIGLLSTIAVSLAPTLADLPRTGAEVIRLAFRLGVLVDEVSQNLKPLDAVSGETGPGDSWAYVVPNVDATEVQKELDSMHEAANIPEPDKIFISALNRTSVTVSGPSSRLKHTFLHSEYFRDRKWIALPVYSGLCHAKHIYDQSHVDRIVEIGALDALDRKFAPRLPVFSTSTGRPFLAETAKVLIKHVITEILTQAIEWDNVIHGIVQRINDVAASECRILTFRQSLPVHEVVAALGSEIDNIKTTTTDLIPWISKAEVSPIPRGPAQSKLAIVGMSCRLPGGATSTEKFWEILEQGLDVSRVIPADRFDVETHFDPTGKQLNKSSTQYGAFIDEAGLFDAPFFNMSPKEAQVVDPQMRLALVTAYEALERAGYVGNRTASTKSERIGTYYGQAADDYREVNQGQEVSTYYIPGGCRAFGPGRINYFFKFAGPSYSIDTACSSGLAAVEVACKALWNGDVDTAVTGGVNILTNPDGFTGLCSGHFLTKGHNACKTWDATADGYCRADGVGSLVIKRLEDAEADNDHILGVILGAGTNHSADAVSITHPHAGHQAYLARQVLRQSGVDPLDVSYVELHGTGTQAGDHEEMQGILDVYAPLTKRRNKTQPLHIGAVKSNVGHSESAAGTTALLKVLIMLQKGSIPRHVGIKTEINPRFPKDFDQRNLHIPLENTPWPQIPGKKRLAAINNFGAAGGNTTMILEEAPIRNIQNPDPRQSHVVAVSAKTKGSLAGNIERLIAFVDSNPDTNIADLAYTTTARRYQHSHRIAITTTDIANLKKQLSSWLGKVDSVQRTAVSGPPPVVFAFTGQGASHKSMSLELYRDVPSFRNQIQHLDSLARGQGFPSFIPAINGSYAQDHAHSPTVTQLALTCTEIALAKYWLSLGVRPDVVVGHSLGEYAALHIAGVLSATDTIFLVGRRAQMLEQRCQQGSHKMLAVRASLTEVQEKSAGKSFEVACINGPSDTVLSGTGAEMDALADVLQAAGFKCFSLDVAFAFHSAQTDPILDDFETAAKSAVTFHAPTLPIISPLLGKVIFDEKTINGEYLRRSTRETVNFLSALQLAQKVSIVDETMVWIEIGPHPVCMGFAKAILPSVHAAVPSFRRGESNWQTLPNTLTVLHNAGIDVDWNEFHQPFEKNLRLLDLPTYAFQDKTHWLQYKGDWCLTKGNTFYDAEKAKIAHGLMSTTSVSSLQTSLVQNVLAEDFSASAGKVTIRSDMMHPDFFAATWGHQMNGCGVATSSIHADVAYTLGEYLMQKIKPRSKDVVMNVCNLEVHKGLVASKDKTRPQLIQVDAEMEDVDSGVASLRWHTVTNQGEVSEPFATANILYSTPATWLSEWIPTTHLVQGRIEALERLAEQGIANRLSHNMAYLLFAQNLVDYAQKYRGMQSVVMHELEAFADVTLTTEKGGIWTVPPYFIDSVAHLAGFVMNVSDANDTKNNFFVTPGWDTMRFANPLVAGAKYRSYVKMIPTSEDPTVYLGDVYILQDGVIIGMVGAIKFRRYPRILLDRFFSAPATSSSSHTVAASSTTSASATPPTKPKVKQVAPPKAPKQAPAPAPVAGVQPAAISESQVEAKAIPAAPEAPAAAGDPDSTAVKAVELVANEAGLEIEDLADECSFADLGVDSLMSLVIAEKFREQLGVSVTGSLFLEYPTVGDLRAWLVEYYG